jgi:hypothetical protein
VSACIHFSVLELWRSGQFLNLRVYAAGAGFAHYQTRILLSWVLHYSAGNPRVEPMLSAVGGHLPGELRDPYIVVMLAVTVVSMFVTVLATRATLLYFTGDRRFSSWVALLALYMTYFNLAAMFGLTYLFPYDVTSLAFFGIALWLILTRRYWWLLLNFVVGTLNRETFFFVTAFLLVYTWLEAKREQPEAAMKTTVFKQVVPHVLLQMVIWVALRAWLHHKFLNNPHDNMLGGGLFELQVVPDIKLMLNPKQWPLFLSLFGFTLPLFFSSYRWIGDKVFAKSVVILMVLWFLLMLVVADFAELRVFSELTVFLVPAVGLIFWNRWVRPVLTAESQSPLAPAADGAQG